MSEYIIQVDEHDNVIGSVERLTAHLNDGILHRGLVVVVKNADEKVLFTQRSMNRPDLGFPPPFPGFWDITIAGHPKWGQTDYVTQMVNEVHEDLGIQAKASRIKYLGMRRSRYYWCTSKVNLLVCRMSYVMDDSSGFVKYCMLTTRLS